MKKLLLLGAAAFVTLAITGCSCPFMGDKCGKCDKDCKCEMKDAKSCDKKDMKCDAPATPATPAPAAPAK